MKYFFSVLHLTTFHFDYSPTLHLREKFCVGLFTKKRAFACSKRAWLDPKILSGSYDKFQNVKDVLYGIRNLKFVNWRGGNKQCN